MELFSKPSPKTLELYCDNPRCGIVLQTSQVAYDAEHREIYHPLGCPGIAASQRASTLGERIERAKPEYIGMDRAWKLFREGKLNQSKKSEARVISPL